MWTIQPIDDGYQGLFHNGRLVVFDIRVSELKKLLPESETLNTQRYNVKKRGHRYVQYQTGK